MMIWNALTALGTLALAVATFVSLRENRKTLRENRRLTEQLHRPQVSISGTVEFKGGFVDDFPGESEFFAPKIDESVVSFIRFEVYNLSVFPIQLVQFEDANSSGVPENCPKLIPPQTYASVDLEISREVSSPVELSFRYAGQDKGYYRLRFTFEPLVNGSQYRVHPFDQELTRI